jgi:hypothetical protein
VLTERGRQEEDGWPDQPGDPRGRRTAHGTGDSHLCLLHRKHQVEDAIYAIGERATCPGLVLVLTDDFRVGQRPYLFAAFVPPDDLTAPAGHDGDDLRVPR